MQAGKWQGQVARWSPPEAGEGAFLWPPKLFIYLIISLIISFFLKLSLMNNEYLNRDRNRLDAR